MILPGPRHAEVLATHPREAPNEHDLAWACCAVGYRGELSGPHSVHTEAQGKKHTKVLVACGDGLPLLLLVTTGHIPTEIAKVRSMKRY